MAKAEKRNYYRLVLQWGVLGLLLYLLIRPLFDRTYIADFEAYCPFGGLQAISSYLANNSLACSMTTTQIFMGLALLAGVFVFSKLFCGYICPIGTFTEWLGRMGGKLKMNIVIKGLADRLLRIFKYAILFITFYFSVSSSELFCKKFDPYYVVFSGFGPDVMMAYAVIALLLAIPGSFFIRQFWCKYFCPLSAASNIFTYGFVFLGITGLYALLVLVFKVSIGWIWLLAALSLAGVLLETVRMKSRWLPVLKITREAETCTSCRLCDKVCPMAIRISDQPQVDHIDCHLCGDCITKCPEPDTLKINHRPLRWLPALATVGLIAFGLYFASVTDIPTVSLKWGTPEQMESAGIFRQSGLKSVKCYGSSMSFANHMKEVEGVLGVETFVSDYSVKVYFDKAVTDEHQLREAIFTPVKRLLAAPDAGVAQISVAAFGIDQFFDPGDASLLAIRAGQQQGILAMETQFGEPVHALFYYDAGLVSPSEISAVISARKVIWEVDGEVNEAKTKFEVASMAEKEAVSLQDYLLKMYEVVEMNFNGFEDYTEDKIDTLSIDFNQSANPELTDMPWYLLSHASNNRGIVGFATDFSDAGIRLQIQFVTDLTDSTQIVNWLNEPVMQIHMNDGTKQEVSNPYHF